MLNFLKSIENPEKLINYDYDLLHFLNINLALIKKIEKQNSDFRSNFDILITNRC